MKKIYNIKRTFWQQEELEWNENSQIKPFLKELETAFAGEDKSFGTIVERIYDTDIVPEILKVILKPYQPNILWYAWNEFWAKRNKVDRTNVAASMKNSEIAQVLADFFLFNTKWIADLQTSPNGSGTSSTPSLMKELLRPLTKSFLSLRTGTSPGRN